MTRRLAAVLAADVVGYSSMMGDDEIGTHSELKNYRKNILDPNFADHNGRIVKVMGDGLLVEFASVVDAVECAIAIQRLGNSDANGRFELRIGINLGDIIIDGDDIYGDGVNIAARLESMCDTGGICVSGIVYDSVGNRVDAYFADAGEHLLKNIDQAIRVYRWVSEKGLKDVLPLSRHRSFDKPSIAVLAFDNMSGDPDQEYFSDGIAEDIITSLSHFREFFVIARNSSFTYKGQAIRVDQVCRDLGVRYLLEGSVRKVGHRVRITAQLIDGENGAHLWAAKYDRNLDDIFAVQDEITQAIVSAVAPETLGAELKRSQAKPARNLSAWDKVLQARWHLAKLTRADNEMAQRMLQESIESASDLSDAFSTLALCDLHGMLHLWRSDPNAAIASATEAAKHAVSLDDNNANAYAMLGMSELFGRNYEDSIRYLERAIQLNPNLAHAYGVLAAVHGVSGDYSNSKIVANRALDLSPRDPSKAFWLGGVGIGAYIAKQYEDCISVSRQVLKEHPGYASSMRQETAALAMLKRKNEASASLERLLDRIPGLTLSQVRQMVPIRNPDDHEHWLEGLRVAGLPE